MVHAVGDGIHRPGRWPREALDARWCAIDDRMRWRCQHLIGNAICLLLVGVSGLTNS
jgi:hypothetical protein